VLARYLRLPRRCAVEEARDRRELIVESVASMAVRCREGRIKRIVVALETGRDGFWLTRWLRARDIEVHVAWLQHRSGPWTDRKVVARSIRAR
jgi:hypothetical protein